MSLNLATAAFFAALVELALGIGMLTLWARERRRYLIYWSLGFLVFGVGSLLISLRNRVPDFFSIQVANFSLTLSSILFYVGICLFFDRRRSWLPWMVVVISLETALLAYYSYVTYDTSVRVYVYSAAQALIGVMILQTLFTVSRTRGKSVNPEVVVVTLCFLIAHTARMAGTPLFPVPQDFLASGNFQTLLAFGLMLIHILYALAFGNMHASALNANLSAALNDVKEKDRQKVEVLGYIGHDLRAPLATISGYSALLLANADENQHKLLETIQRSVKYQLDLIDELLEYAKAELQPLTVHPGTTDLPRLLDEISEYAIALCSQQNNRFRYRASDRMPRQVSMDGKRLQQVLLNLLSNAAKFTRDGTVTLSVTAQSQDGACALHFAVSDTGIGIDLNKNADIFGAFQQIQSASGSTGLGLFIAQRIVSAMGGTLSVTSIAGQETTFLFVLSVPIVDSSDSNWSNGLQREVDPPARRSDASLHSSATLDDQALSELATLALLGQLTDIEHWIKRHSRESAPTPFMSHLRELLEQFDFASIEELALNSRSQSSV
ncbi:MAG: HAMP domain-containing histidine kinase [Comamonadaceae bacterium]|nr:HAMP domain-containing histidine kinase [Comamonadaceae bacterium]